jgi:MFS transporter, FHS family, L-fucose permease
MKNNNNNQLYAFGIIGSLFFIFGLLTWLNGILIPFLKKACELTDLQSYFVATAFFAAYFIMPIPSSYILKRLGTKRGMSIGLLIMAIGTLIFLPAANSRTFGLFLTGLFVQGTGLALLQTASNPYISVIGPIESAAQRISIMGICNKLAGIIGNLVFGAILLNNVDTIQKQITTTQDASVKEQLLSDLVGRVHTPYLVLALILVAIAGLIYSSNLPDLKETTDNEDTDLSRDKTSIFQFRHVILGFFAIFFYVGAEVMAGDLITIYGKNLGFLSEDTKFFTTFGLVGLLLGYVVSILIIPKYVKQETWLSVSAVLGLILTVCSYFVGERSAVFCLAALGFANAVMWPAIFPLGIKNLGRFTNEGSAILVMGIVGGAIVPPFYGWLYENTHLFDFRSAFVAVMVVCYLYILWFGRQGHKA